MTLFAFSGAMTLFAFSGAIARNSADSANSVKINNSVATLASSHYSGAIARK